MESRANHQLDPFSPEAAALDNFGLGTSSIDRLSAMKLYVSVWQFQSTKLNVERNIQFHEPHPHGKFSFTTARHFGRRLNRAYGWFGRMFVLGEK
jgi:hypothetical protein